MLISAVEHMNVEMVKSLKNICSEKLCGSFRMPLRISIEEGTIKYIPKGISAKGICSKSIKSLTGKRDCKTYHHVIRMD